MRRSSQNTHEPGGHYYWTRTHLHCFSIPVLQGAMHYLDSYPGIVFVSGIRQSSPSGNEFIISQRCLIGWRSLERYVALQAGSASFHNNQSCSTPGPRFIVIEHSLTDCAACFSIVCAHRRHDYAILQPHLPYVRWLKNLLESNCSHRWLLSLFTNRIAFSPKFTTKPEPIIHTFGLNLLSYHIMSFKAWGGFRQRRRWTAMFIMVVKKFSTVRNSSFGAPGADAII